MLATPSIRSESLWYQDGNVILQAEGMQYKVYKGLLAQQSTIFKDMFSLPQPSETMNSDMVEGCPVVHLSDAAGEVTFVLEEIFLRRYAGQLILGFRALIMRGDDDKMAGPEGASANRGHRCISSSRHEIRDGRSSRQNHQNVVFFLPIRSQRL